MYKFSDLLKDFPPQRESRMISSGFAVWVVWKGDLSEAIPQTLQDYGGMLMSQDSQQALWFFFTKDVFLGLARLQIWANLNELPVFVQVIPTKIMIGFQLEKSLSIASELYGQQAFIPDEFEVWIHPGVREYVEGIPGIQLQPVDTITGMASATWHSIVADPRMNYPSSQAWYFILKPLGNPLDKQFVEGWRRLFAELEVMLQRLKLKFILHDNFLIFPLDNFNALKVWVLEILNLVRRLKKPAEEGADPLYWPSVMAVVDKGTLSFNEELPNKVQLDWNQMAPDFPHMSYRTAFLLGERFKIKDISYSLERSRLSDWCYVHLAGDDEDEEARGSLQVNLPVTLLAGQESPCFYCGLRNHQSQECPSRSLKLPSQKSWEKLGVMPLEKINEKFQALGEELGDDPVQALSSNLSGDGPNSDLVKAHYEINFPSQLRMTRLVWRSIGQELPSGLKKLGPKEQTAPMKLLDQFLAGDVLDVERLLKQEALRNPRDYEYRTLQGFLYMEKGEYDRAMQFWKEAETLSDNALQYGYHIYLQGRLQEVQNRFDTAAALYRQAAKTCPKWLEPVYRRAVCMVKMGFSEHSLNLFDELIKTDPHMFNRTLIDPELERGYIQILSYLWNPWSAAKEHAAESATLLGKLSSEFDDWFGTDHEFSRTNRRKINHLLEFKEVENYVVFLRLINGHQRLNKALKARVAGEVRIIEKQAESFSERLKHIHREISWFPFPKALREFNKDFNFCVLKIKWVREQHFQLAENFRRSRDFFAQVETKLKRLDSRLVTLKIVRDSTLFMLILGKGFMWLEIIGLGLALLLVPLGIYMANKMETGWISEIVTSQTWALQKGLVIVLSIVALTVSTLRTALVFDKKKAKLFEEYEHQEAEARKAHRAARRRR